jgi:hypothetical protein
MRLFTLLMLISFNLYAYNANHYVVASYAEAEFVDAIRQNNLIRVEQALTDGANVNLALTSDSGKRKPIIFYALENHYLELFKLLLSRGADVNVTKDADSVYNYNLLMVAFEREAQRSDNQSYFPFIKILLENQFDYRGKNFQLNFNPYTKGGKKGNEDVVTVILSNSNGAKSLSYLYSFKNITPAYFEHSGQLLRENAKAGNVKLLNLYLNFNEQKTSSVEAKSMLEELTVQFSAKNHQTINLELITRLREIAY